LPPPLLRLGQLPPLPSPLVTLATAFIPVSVRCPRPRQAEREDPPSIAVEQTSAQAAHPGHATARRRSSEMWHTFSRTCCHRRLFSIAAKQHAGTRSSVSITLHALQCCVARAVHSPVGKVFIRLVYFVTTPLFIAVSHTSTSYQVIL